MIRGRLGGNGFRGVTLATLCDLIWVEIWDDCSPMANQSTYREIMTRLFLKGEHPSTITYKGADGKNHRLAPPGTRQASKVQLADARKLWDEIRNAKKLAKEAEGLVSSPDAG